MIPYFEDLGRNLDTAWSKLGRDEAVFADLAVEHLAASPPAENTSAEEIIAWFFSPFHAPEQPAGTDFGQPPIKLFQGHGFYIEALFWMEASTAIHQHGFSGAFTPILGSSVHTSWSFEQTRRFQANFRGGRLKYLHSEILRSGDVREIRAGKGFIHQLFHLETPSVTIVVRTRWEDDQRPQFSYLPPGLAFNPFREDPVLQRRLELLGVMSRSGLRGGRGYVAQMMSGGDLRGVYETLAFLGRQDLGPEVLSEAAEIARRHHGDVIDLFLETIEQESRIRLISQLRSTITAPDHRLFLALLMLMPDRDAILRMVAAENPESDPVDTVMRWARELSGTETIGIELDALNTSIFRSLVEGLDRDGLLRRLIDEYGRDQVAELREEILSHASRIRASRLFATLFSRAPWG